MADDRLSVVLVGDANDSGIVPIRVAGRRFTVPLGSVTLRAIERAAGKVRGQQDGRTVDATAKGPSAQLGRGLIVGTLQRKTVV